MRPLKTGRDRVPERAWLNIPFPSGLIVILLWGILFLPFANFPALHLEEGTHAGVAQDIMLRQHWLTPKLLGALPYVNKSAAIAVAHGDVGMGFWWPWRMGGEDAGPHRNVGHWSHGS